MSLWTYPCSNTRISLTWYQSHLVEKSGPTQMSLGRVLEQCDPIHWRKQVIRDGRWCKCSVVVLRRICQRKWLDHILDPSRMQTYTMHRHSYLHMHEEDCSILHDLSYLRTICYWTVRIFDDVKDTKTLSIVRVLTYMVQVSHSRHWSISTYPQR